MLALGTNNDMKEFEGIDQVTEGSVTQCEGNAYSGKSWHNARKPGELVLFHWICKYFPNHAEKLGSEASMLKTKNGDTEVKDTPFPFMDLPLSSLQEVAELGFIPVCHIILFWML